MKSSTFTPLPVPAVLAWAFVATLSGYGQTAPHDPPPPSRDETVALPAYRVTENYADRYNSPDAISASRVVGKIIDTPMTVNVITPALLEDIGPMSMYAVAQYFGGVSPGRGTGPSGINDRMTFRGFESFSRTWDNFSSAQLPGGSAVGNNIDPVFIDHAELIMGPDSILSPTGTPGGSINLITKSPLFDRSVEVTAMVGNYNANKYAVDLTGPVGASKHMAYRVIGAYQDARTYAQGANLVFSGEAAFTYQFNPTAKLTFKYFGSEVHSKGTAALSNLNGQEIYTADTVGGVTLSNTPQPGFTYNGWNGDATWSQRVDRNNVFQSELTAALGERVNMRLAGQVTYKAESSFLGYPSSAIPETWDPQTGKQIAVAPINPAAVSEVASFQHYMSRQIQFQNDFAGNFQVGGVSIQPVAGWAYQQGSVPVSIFLQNKTMPPANLAVGHYDPPLPDLSTFTSFAGGNTPGSGWQAQAYTFVRIGFLNDRVFATGGASRTWVNVHNYSFPGIYLRGFGQFGLPGPATDATFAHTGNALVPSVRPVHDTYMAGLLGKVLPNVSVYYSFSTNAGIASGAPRWQAGKQHEFGVKTTFFDGRLAVNADHFQITQSNLSSTNPLYNTGQSTIPVFFVDVKSQGYEFNVVGGITPDLSVIASYTEMKLRDAFGRRQRNIPDKMANVLLNYRFSTAALKGGNIFVGVVHQGNVAGENATGFSALGVPYQPGFYVAAWTAINAGAGYRVGRYRFNLNIDNVLDDHFWWQASSRTSLAPYDGRTYRFTTSIKF